MNEKPIPITRRRFEVTVTVHEIVNNHEYYDPFAAQNFRTVTGFGEYDPRQLLRVPDPKIPKTIKEYVGNLRRRILGRRACYSRWIVRTALF